jgi:uncharacterized RDD family membrane protein YckC
MISTTYSGALTLLPLSEAIWKKTLGKRCLGLEVIMEDHKPVMSKYAFIRFFLHPINIGGFTHIFISFFGYVEVITTIYGILFSIVIFTEVILAISNNKSLADMIANTLVTQKSKSYEIK